MILAPLEIIRARSMSYPAELALQRIEEWECNVVVSADHTGG